MDRLMPAREKGRFVNPAVTQDAPEATFRTFLKWHRERVSPPKEFHVPRVDAPAPPGPPPAVGMRVTWVGHSTVLLQIDGRTYLTDPVWSSRIGGVIKRQTPPGIPFSSLPRIDAILLSHDHYDHLDAGTLTRFPRDIPVLAPTGVGPWLRKRGFHRVVERSWWEETSLDGHRVTAVPAQHFSGRTPWGRDTTLWCGWVVQGSEGSSAWFAGDSGYFSGFRQIGDAFPGLDVALVPAGAYLPRWFMSVVHVDPGEAAQAFVDSRAKRLLPIHWGAFRLADEPIDAPPGELTRIFGERGIDRSKLLLPRLGEAIDPMDVRASAARVGDPAPAPHTL